MALGTPVAAAAAYNATAGGTTVTPAYPAGILATDVVLLFVGQKPSTANGGTVTTPTGWTLREELTGAGGYGATLGADTGNTNLRVYSWNTPVAGQTGNLTVTLGTNNISWAFMVRIPSGGGALSYGSADGQRTTAPTVNVAFTVNLTNGATATNFQTGDRAIWAMCIPTDVTTPGQFSAPSVTATGATFGAATELNEPDSGTGNDIGGYSAWAAVTAGSSTAAPSVTVTAGGTVTNVRGPIVLLRVREGAIPPVTGTLAATESGSDTFAGAGDVLVEGSLAATESGSDTFAATGTVTSGGITGTMAVTETGSDTFAGAGDVIVKGTLAATESGSDTFAAAGDVIVRGSMAAIETGADTFSASGDVIVQGAMAATETGSDIFAATGGTVTLGTMAATESGSDTLAASGTVLVQGAMAATESGQDVMAATGVVTTAGIVGTMSATESGADFTDGYTYPEYVEPPGYYAGWTGFVTDAAPTGGGGPGNAINIQRRKPRGWANERAAFEQSLLEPDEQRQADLGRIAQTLADSGQAQAQRIARKLADYTGELTQVESLQRELAKLEAVQRSRELWAERNQDVQAAAAELSDILRDDEDLAGALVALHEHETRLMLGVLGITMK